jgi:hypothetical protein
MPIERAEELSLGWGELGTKSTVLSTCQGMYGSGVTIGMTAVSIRQRKIDAIFWGRLQAARVLCPVVAGIVMPGIADVQRGVVIPPRTDSISSAFDLRSVVDPDERAPSKTGKACYWRS